MMHILEKTKKLLYLAPKRIPKKIKNSKRWRINLTDLEYYIENFAKQDNKDNELQKIS